MHANPSRSRRWAGLAVSAGVVLGAAACSGTTTTTGAGDAGSTSGDGPGAVAVSFGDGGCDPAEVTTTAGTVRFTVKNTGGETGEFEVVQDDRIKGEAENIAPNFTKEFTATLDPGTYVLVCGRDKAPKGTLTVAAATSTPATAATSGTVPGTATAAAMGAIVEQYRSYILDEAQQLQTQTTAFTKAVTDGDLATAQALYAPTRAHYETIEPVAEVFKDLDAAIDARVDDFEGVDDPTWTGFHRLEYSLFEQRSTDGLAPIASQLNDDVAELVGELATVEIPPVNMVKGAQELMEEVSSGKITGEEERYSHTDLSDFDANVDGSQKIWILVRPMAEAEDATLTAAVDDGFEDVTAKLAPYQNADGTWKSYTELTEEDQKALGAIVAELSEKLSQLPGALDLQ